MQKIIYFFLAGMLLLQGCKLNDVSNPDEAKINENEQIIQQYITANNLQMQTTNSGLRYAITYVSPQGKAPQKGDQIVMSYVGKLTNGTVFDTALVDPNRFLRFPFNVNATKPVGLDEMAGYMKAGDSAKAILPFYLGLGRDTFVIKGNTIPAYSVLVFDLKLVAVQTETEALQDYLNRKSIPANRVKTTASGLRYYFTETNTTATPVNGKRTVTVKYKGMFLDGSVFDQTVDDRTATFEINRLVSGFSEGLNLMRVNEKAVLLLPSNLAYKETGSYPKIPPYSPLVFEVTVVSAQ